MPRKWQVWGQPDGSLVWIPARDAPPTPAAAAPGPPHAALPNPPPPDDAPIEGPGGDGGSRFHSMADLFVEARSKLLKGDGVAGATVDSGKGGLFSTGSGRLMAVSEGGLKRARVLVGEEGEDATNNRKEPFGGGTCAEREPSKTDVPLRGGMLRDNLSPMFQTGSGNAVSLGDGSIQKAVALLEGNNENDAGPRQPMFRTGMGRSVPVSRGSIDKAWAVLEGQPAENEGDVGHVNGMEQVPFFQTGSGRAVPVNTASIEKAKAVLEGNDKNEGGVLRDNLSPMFQTGSGNAVSPGERSIQKAVALLEGNDENATGARQPKFRTGMGRSVPVSRGSIEKARTVLEGQTVENEGDVGRVDGMEQLPLFQTGSGRAVPVNMASIQKAKAVLEGNNINGGNVEDFGGPGRSLLFQNCSKRPALISERSVERSKAMTVDENAEINGQWDTGCRLPIFQTGLGNPVAIKQSSIQKAKTVLEEDVKRSGNGDMSVCALSFQTETPKSVLMSSSLIMNDRTVTPKGNIAVQVEEKDKADDHLPLFQTGSGRLVAVTKSSIRRASAVLEPRNIAKELEDEAHLNDGCATSIFKTGSGKSILASKNSREKAHSVLGAEEGAEIENPIAESGVQQFILENVSSSHKASIHFEQGKFADKGHGDCGIPFPMFQTGSGKSVLVSERSVRKARSVLEEEGDANRDNHKLVNVEKKVPIFASPLKTSSVRTVNISSVGVSRAATLLGLEENTLSTQFFGHVGEKLGTKITVERKNPECRLDVARENAISVDPRKGYCQSEKRIFMDAHEQMRFSKSTASDSGEHSIRFSTAGGQSMAISSDALQRAKSLLGESEDPLKDSAGCSLASASKEKLPNSTIYPKDEPDLSHISRANRYASPDTPATKRNANRLHVGREYHPVNEIPKIPKPPSRSLTEGDNASEVKYNIRRHHMPAGALVDITNCMAPHSGSTDHFSNGKRILEGRNSISPFKRPRSSRFITPIKTNKLMSAGESKLLSVQISPCRTKLSAHYPFQHQRKAYKEYFGGPPCFKYLTAEHVTNDVKLMDAVRAEKYKFQHTGTGADEFQKMLLACGASLSYATKEWVINHYKWIVWKLASLERSYPTIAGGKFFTVANVFEELKYRYDREVNHGHRSAIKKILEGNASPSLMMVLCISAIYSTPDPNNKKLEVDKVDTDEDSNQNNSLSAANKSAKIELTDGWYSLDASLDVALSEQLEKRKLFLGQKLRIWGASLCGWAGPVSFSEASGTVKLMVHINGTYRARWNESLGFCKHIGLPLAFKCIKAAGGRVPRTLVGLTRIYPVLYRERLPDGRFIVRSEKMERKALQLYQQRVSNIAEDIMFEQQENCGSVDDDDEGAKICKMLERAAEPEAIMAGMTSEQLMHFSSYKERQKVIMQDKVVKKVEKALEVADLSSRDVTPFLKVRVVSLVSQGSASKESNKEGLITIWNPTEMQKADLVEGQIYSVTGLVPSNYCTEILQLNARGSSTMWKPLTSSQTTYFKPFFTSRKAIELSKFGEVPLSSEFDIAGVILYVGNIYLCSNQKRQWLFMTDGSKFISGHKSEDQDCLLAISISSPTTGEDSALFSYSLDGNIVGFSNLVKRQKDQMRQIWVAEATETSTHTLFHEIPRKSHLEEAATSAERWASKSYPKIQELKERVLCIVGDSGG